MKKNKELKKYRKRAFTFVELLASMAIIAIMITISTDITVKLMRASLKSDIRADVDRNINYAVETIKRNIISSKSVSQISNVAECIYAPNCIKTSYNGGNLFALDNNNKLVQCKASDTGCSAALNLVGNDVIILNNSNFQLYVDQSTSFVQIIFDATDSSNIVYPSSTPFKTVTGAVFRGGSGN